MSANRGPGTIGRVIPAIGIAAGLAAPAPAAAKERLVRHLGAEDGLRPERVSAIAQDEAGFLWLGTGGGLVRYDGERVVPWATAAIRTRIDRIAIHRGAVIAAAWEGPVFRTTTASPEAIELRGPGGASLIGARHVAFDRAGRLWLVRRDGQLLRSSDLGATWSTPLAGSPAGVHARAVREAIAPGGGLYVLAADALWTVDAADRATLACELWREHPGEGAVDALPMPDGSVLATLSSGGVQRCRPGAGLSVVWRGTEHGRSGRMARRGDVAWVAFTDALMAVRPGREPEVLPIRQGPAYGGRAIFVDREGSLWVGNARGAFQLPEPETVAWDLHDGLPSPGAVSLARTEEGIWVLLWGFMLGRIDPEPAGPTWLEELAALAAPRPPPAPRARRIEGIALARACPDERGVLWGRAVAPGQPSRLVTRRPGERFEVRPEAPGSADCAPARGGGVWIANERSLWITDGDELRALAPLPPLAAPEVPRLAEGASGTLWHATPGRLCRASVAALRAGRGAWTCAPIAVQSVTGLAEMPSGAVWIASNWSRVTRWSTEGSGPLPGAAALPSNVTDVLEPAADGGVWIGGLGYLLRVEERTDRPEGWAVLEELGPDSGAPALGAVDVHEDPEGTL